MKGFKIGRIIQRLRSDQTGGIRNPGRKDAESIRNLTIRTKRFLAHLKKIADSDIFVDLGSRKNIHEILNNISSASTQVMPKKAIIENLLRGLRTELSTLRRDILIQLPKENYLLQELIVILQNLSNLLK